MTEEKWRLGDEETVETGRRGDWMTKRLGDLETRRQGDEMTR